MSYTLNFGRSQMAITINRKRGRPKKPFPNRVFDYISLLSKTANSKRYAGNPMTRILRRLLENKKLGQIFGANLAVFTLVTGVTVPSISAFNKSLETENTAVNPVNIQITTERSVQKPLDSFEISQGYHIFHQAIDFKEAIGAPIYPIMEGEVKEAVFSRSAYGNFVIIDHGSGFESLYAHMTKIVIQKGEKVTKNTVLGTVGTTGRATGAHLHLEVYDHNQAFNPLTILQ
ncbi:M23 family metallopeptidase [Patescibacteria group bacterium]